MTSLDGHTSRPYQIHIGRGLLGQTGALCREVSSAARALVVTDSNVRPLYADTVVRSLEEAGFAADVFVFPAGEEHKRLEVISSSSSQWASGSSSGTAA